MKKLNLFKLITLALGLATLAMTTLPAEAGDIKAHAGTTFFLSNVEVAGGIPTKFTHTWDGVVRVSLLGNCRVHGVVDAVLLPNGSYSLAGTCQITSADGNTILDAIVEGVATPDPNKPDQFSNFHYDVKFTGGKGRMENAQGRADIDGVAMFTSPDGGTATWLLEGNVTTRGRHGR